MLQNLAVDEWMGFAVRIVKSIFRWIKNIYLMIPEWFKAIVMGLFIILAVLLFFFIRKNKDNWRHVSF